MDWLSAMQWQPCTAPLTCGSSQRSPAMLDEVVAQFRVKEKTRYTPVGKATWCNIFVNDVTRALACEVPHWWLGKELTANDMLKWLGDERGLRHGWRSCNTEDAIARASLGFPTVVVWANPNGPGHIAILKGLQDRPVPLIAQAGATNFERGTVLEGFGPRQVLFFPHD